MTSNNTAGIDYGRGQTNVDLDTNVRYGVINLHSVSPEALVENIYSDGENLSYNAWYEQVVAEIKASLSSAIDPYCFDVDRHLDNIDIEGLMDSMDLMYESDNDQYRYTGGGYILETTDLGLYVIKSPYYTHCRYCSPCAPGAGDLDSHDALGVKAYCLGPEWFDDYCPKLRYPVYTVDGDTVVAVPAK